jgi:hypothetical protein
MIHLRDRPINRSYKKEYRTGGLERVEKAKPDPLNLTVKTDVGSKSDHDATRKRGAFFYAREG